MLKFPILKTIGRYIEICSIGTNYLNLAEVVVIGEINGVIISKLEDQHGQIEKLMMEELELGQLLAALKQEVKILKKMMEYKSKLMEFLLSNHIG